MSRADLTKKRKRLFARDMVNQKRPVKIIYRGKLLLSGEKVGKSH